MEDTFQGIMDTNNQTADKLFREIHKSDCLSLLCLRRGLRLWQNSAHHQSSHLYRPKSFLPCFQRQRRPWFPPGALSLPGSPSLPLHGQGSDEALRELAHVLLRYLEAQVNTAGLATGELDHYTGWILGSLQWMDHEGEQLVWRFCWTFLWRI